MIKIKVYLNGKYHLSVYAKYYGMYTSNPCGYEYFIGHLNAPPYHANRDFTRRLLIDLNSEKAKFVHGATNKEISIEEVLKILCLEG